MRAGPIGGPDSPDSWAGSETVGLAAKRRRVRLLVTIVLVGTVTAIAYHYAIWFYYSNRNAPSTFLFIPVDHFNDWDNLYIFAQDYLRGIPGPFAYFPFAILLAVAATVLPMRLGFVLVAALFLVILVLTLRNWVVDCEEHALTRIQYGFVLVALSYPVLFVLDRGNVEMLVFVFIAGFLYFLYVRESTVPAAVFLAAAIAFKLYPATLLLLLLAERRFRALALTLVMAVGFTALGALAVTAIGHYSLAELWDMNSSGKDLYQASMVTHGGGVQHGHSLWGAMAVPRLLLPSRLASWQITLYALVAGLMFTGFAVHAVFRETERWKLVLLAVAPALLLPYVSADYTLIHLYFPLVFFLNSPRVSRWDVLYVSLFGVLLIPVDYYYFAASPPGVSTSVLVYSAALLALLLIAVWDPIRAGSRSQAESAGA